MRTNADRYQEKLNELEGSIVNDILEYFQDSKYGFYEFKTPLTGYNETEILGIEIESLPDTSMFSARLINEEGQVISMRLDNISAGILIRILEEIEQKRIAN